MATADSEPRSDQLIRSLPRWLVPVAFVATLAIAVVIGLVVTSDEASAPPVGSATTLVALEVEADSIYEFATLAEMAAASDAIVVGTVIATEPGRLVGDPANGGVISRIVTIQADDVLRDDAQIRIGATVVIEEEGTLPDGTPLIVNGVGRAEVGDHGIWFLDRLDDAELPAYLVINSQGRFLTRVDDPDGGLIGGDQRDVLVQQLQQQSLVTLVAATREALSGG